MQSTVLSFIRDLAGSAAGADQSDELLLQHFLARRDESAFASLLHRHGPLVLGVCRQLLGDGHAAEDVFQATFLVLARKAAVVRRQRSLSAWLYRVASNLALDARRADARRRFHERQAVAMQATAAAPQNAASDWQPIVHEEVSRLPAKYRAPVVLCYLEGKTNEEAARLLHWPVGTVKGRLTRARDLLRKRLLRRGVAPAIAAAAWPAGAIGAAVPAGLHGTTLTAALLFAAGRTAATASSAGPAVQLALRATRSMTMIRLRFVSLFFLIALAAAATAAIVASQASPGPDLAESESGLAMQPAEQPAGPAPVEVTAWGAEEAGLRLRAKTVKKIEQGMPLQATLEWTAAPGRLPAGVKRLNSYLYAGYASLVLVHGQSGKKYTITPFDPTAGMPAADNGKTAELLDGSVIKPWLVSFPLVTLGDTLEPGPYVGKVKFSFPNKPTGWWSGTQATWDAAGFWHGTAQSGDLMLTVLKATPRTKTFVLPKQLRVDKELKIIFAKDDAESVALPVRNGYFVSAKLSRNGQSYSLRDVEGLRTYDVDQWRDYKGGPIKSTYTIEIFETADPPVHKWHPGPGSGGYKVLWQKSFTLEFTEEQIKKIQAGASASNK